MFGWGEARGLGRGGGLDRRFRVTRREVASSLRSSQRRGWKEAEDARMRHPTRDRCKQGEPVRRCAGWMEGWGKGESGVPRRLGSWLRSAPRGAGVETIQKRQGVPWDVASQDLRPRRRGSGGNSRRGRRGHPGTGRAARHHRPARRRHAGSLWRHGSRRTGYRRAVRRSAAGTGRAGERRGRRAPAGARRGHGRHGDGRLPVEGVPARADPSGRRDTAPIPPRRCSGCRAAWAIAAAT